MTIAGEIFDRCRSVGVTLSVGLGNKLEWEANIEPPASLLVLLKKHKTDLLRALANKRVSSSPSDWRLWVADAIAEDLGLPKDSLTLHPFPAEVCPGCAYCDPAQRVPPT